MDDRPSEPSWATTNDIQESTYADVLDDDIITDPFDRSVLVELDKLRNPKSSWAQTLIILAISIALFAGLGMRDNPIAFTLMLIVVLFVHEMGHYVGMRLFGYRNVRIFFIPLFGAATSGQRTTAKGYQEAIVTLLGPVPGLCLAIALLITALVIHRLRWPFENYLFSAAALFGLINAFNLLPIFPMDGGRLLNQLLFSRNRYLEGVFLVVASVGMIGLGVLMKMTMFWIIGIWMLLTVGATFRTNSVADRARRKFGGSLPEISEEIPVPIFRAVVADARAAFPNVKTPNGVAAIVFRVWERMHVQLPSAWATVSLLAAYVVGWLLTAPWVLLFVLSRIKH